jgi:lysophospholipase L1-like esterase
MRRRRLPVRALKLAMAAISTLFALGAVELALRVLDWPSADPVWKADDAAGFHFAENVNYRHIQPEYDVAFATNRLGQRDDEPADKQGLRVLLLGDSFTCGYGVERAETFADQLEGTLGVEIINAGVGGYETIHQVKYFPSRGRELHADVVVYAMYLGNDLVGNREWKVDDDGRLVRVDGSPALKPPREMKLVSLAKRSVGLRRSYHAARQCVAPRSAEVKVWKPDGRYVALCSRGTLSQDAQADLALTKQLLAELREEVRSSGAKFLVVTIPTRVDVESEAKTTECDYARPSREVQAILDELRIANIALLESLRQDQLEGSAPLYYPQDGHLTPAGHARVSEHLATWIRAALPSP